MLDASLSCSAAPCTSTQISSHLPNTLCSDVVCKWIPLCRKVLATKLSLHHDASDAGMHYLEGPEGSSDWDEGCASKPDEARRQPVGACIVRQLSIPLRVSQPGSCAGSKGSSQACTCTHRLEAQRKHASQCHSRNIPARCRAVHVARHLIGNMFTGRSCAASSGGSKGSEPLLSAFIAQA